MSRQRIVAAAIVTAALGCSENSPELVGRWVLDTQAATAELEERVATADEELSEEVRSRHLAMIEAVAPTLDLRSDGTIDASVGGHAVRGTWRIASRNGPRFEVAFTRSGEDGAVEESTLFFDFLARDRCRISSPGSDQSFPLRRDS